MLKLRQLERQNNRRQCDAVLCSNRYKCIGLRNVKNLELLTIGMVNDMYAESRNDDCKYTQLSTQEDFDRF